MTSLKTEGFIIFFFGGGGGGEGLIEKTLDRYLSSVYLVINLGGRGEG